MENQIFNFNGRDFSVIMNENGNPIFNANDVCRILGYSNPRDAVATHCKSDGVAKRDIIDSLGRIQQSNYLSEGNLYRLVLKSNKPEAEPFEAFVCDEVLPSIRKHGAYATPMTIDSIIADPDTAIKLLITLKEEREEKKKIESELYQAKEFVEIQHKEIEKLQPDAEYTKKVLTSKDTFTTSQIAKEFGLSARTLNKKLHALGVQYCQHGQWLLYSKYQDKGYTKTNTYSETVNEETRSYHSTVWTEKGRRFIHELVKKELAA